MSTRPNKEDAELFAVCPIPVSGTPYILTLTGTAATIASLPKGRYVVKLCGVDAIAASTVTMTVPASGSPFVAACGLFSTNDVYNQAADGAFFALALNSGSGTLGLTRIDL